MMKVYQKANDSFKKNILSIFISCIPVPKSRKCFKYILYDILVVFGIFSTLTINLSSSIKSTHTYLNACMKMRQNTKFKILILRITRCFNIKLSKFKELHQLVMLLYL